MSVAEAVYTKTKARSLAGMKDLASRSYSMPSILDVYGRLISFDQIVLDKLHLLLQVMDVLIRNLILYMDSRELINTFCTR